MKINLIVSQALGKPMLDARLFVVIFSVFVFASHAHN